MPINPAISVSQSPLAPNLITVTDDSTGSDGAITSRRIYFQTPFGTYLVETGTTTSYEPWAYADSSETFDVLPQDYALSIKVDWLDVSNAILYTLTQVYPFAQYGKDFAYYLVQQQAMSYPIVASVPYFNNFAILWGNIVGGVNAVTTGADIAAAQACFDRATNMRLNQQDYFS